MASTVRLQLNSGAIQALLDGAEGVSDLLHDKAAAILSAAQASAPVDTGEYRDSLQIEEDHTDRLVVRVVAADQKSPVIESKYGVLARALDAGR